MVEDIETTIISGMKAKNNLPEVSDVLPGWTAVAKLGEGSYGCVYEIKRELGNYTERSALKIISIPRNNSEISNLKEQGYSNEGLTKHFDDCYESIIQEYSAVKQIKNCINIVNSEDIAAKRHEGEYGWDVFIRMELLSPMLKWLNKRYGEKSAIPDDEIIRCGLDLCKALSACENHKMIHRDIKPQNIMVAEDGTYKLGDFGTARTIEKTIGLTEGVGTKYYMSPEVDTSHKYDFRADIYSLGMVLYWMMNGRRLPFIPNEPEVPRLSDSQKALARRFSGEPLPEPANGSKALKEVVLKACAFQPKDRYQNADEFAEALKKASIGTYKPVKKIKPYYFALGALVIVVAILAVSILGKQDTGSTKKQYEKPASAEIEITASTPNPTATPEPTPSPKPTPSPTPEPKKPGPEDAKGRRSDVSLPGNEFWLEDYTEKIVQPRKGHSVYLLRKPDGDKFDTVEGDTKVTVLAEEKGGSFVKTAAGEFGWITSKYLIDP